MPDITDKCMDNRAHGECCERVGNDNDFTDKCVHDDFCGGCVYQGIDYDEQLAEKKNEVTHITTVAIATRRGYGGRST